MKILLVENNYSDAIVVAKMLTEASGRTSVDLQISSADRLAGAVEQLERGEGTDTMLLDLCLPDARGLEAFVAAHAAAPNVPCIVLASAAGEPAAAEAVRCGAQGYLIKGEITTALLWRSIQHAIEQCRSPEHAQALLAEQARALLGPARPYEITGITRAEQRRDRDTGAAMALDASPTERLQHAQEPEALGHLARGVAHDLNNILMVIKSFGRFAQESVSPGAVAYDDIGEVLRAADRAGGLVAELLACGRRRSTDAKVIDLGVVVTGMKAELQRLAGDRIDVVVVAEELWPVKVDAGQWQQVIADLAANARDSMPEGGTLTIETRNAVIDPDRARQFAGMSSGDYVELVVTDTGAGMTPEAQARVFEPFFTPGDGGTGTGLGLAMCYSAVKQARGHIWLCSEMGKGTTVKVYLPRAATDLPPASRVQRHPRKLSGSETVLVLEDDPLGRAAMVRALTRHGYRVLEAASGEEALLLCARYTSLRIHLLVTDVILGGMSGTSFVERIAPARPEMRVLFTSGSDLQQLVEQRLLHPRAAFLPKPFTPSELVQSVREVLDLAQPGSG